MKKMFILVICSLVIAVSAKSQNNNLVVYLRIDDALVASSSYVINVKSGTKIVDTFKVSPELENSTVIVELDTSVIPIIRIKQSVDSTIIIIKGDYDDLTFKKVLLKDGNKIIFQKEFLKKYPQMFLTSSAGGGVKNTITYQSWFQDIEDIILRKH